MRNKKKKIGLFALFSCMFVASVAFAAFSGVLTINGTVDIQANPFKMIFVDGNGNQVTSISPPDMSDATAEASDLTVSAAGTEISAFNVKLYKKGDTVYYSLKIKNNGGSTAYLDNINIGETTMPKGDGGEALTGLSYIIGIVEMGDGDASCYAQSVDGATVNVKPDGVTEDKNYISVDAGETVACVIEVKATEENSTLFDTDTNETITLGAAKINWTSVDPSKT